MAHRSSGLTARGSLLGGRQMQVERDDEEGDIEDALEGMHERVQRLRQVVGAIEEESTARNVLLDELQASFSRAQAALKATAKTVNKQLKAGGGSG